MEAEKLKKKLNGSILKGKKLKVENARPQKRGFVPEDASDSVDAASEPQRTTRSKRTRLMVEGRELSPDRSVKRGWTEPEKGARSKSKMGDKAVKSKYTDQKECLFRTQIPPNKEDLAGSTKKKQRRREGKDKDKKDKENGAVVHEFEKSVNYPGFIKPKSSTSGTGLTTEFVEGKGWVDQEGSLVEEAPRSRRKKPSQKTLASASSRSDGDISQGQAEEDSENAGNASFTHSPDSDAVIPTLEDPLPSSIPIITTTESESTETAKAIPAETAESAPHPLETLFKRPKQAASQTKRPLEIKTAFNFFEPDHSEPGAVPQTPFTTRDLHQRGLRSAAPTPDTALPTRRFFPESSSPEGDAPDRRTQSRSASYDGNGKAPPTSAPSTADQDRDKDGNGKAGESEFAEWFYQHRGENNRAWKKQRREAKKEKRQEENRVRGRRRG